MMTKSMTMRKKKNLRRRKIARCTTMRMSLEIKKTSNKRKKDRKMQMLSRVTTKKKKDQKMSLPKHTIDLHVAC